MMSVVFKEFSLCVHEHAGADLPGIFCEESAVAGLGSNPNDYCVRVAGAAVASGAPPVLKLRPSARVTPDAYP